MLSLIDGIVLYHGSSVEVSSPDLTRCAPRKDFGRGFYLTSSITQARAFSKIVMRRDARERVDGMVPKCGFVSRFVFKSTSDLAVRTFEAADSDWLHCVVAHRWGGPFEGIVKELAETDIIVGKVANDQTNATILAYIAGAYGQMGSESADAICVSFLLPERLQDQACFRTDRALQCLEFQGSEEVWL